MCVRPYGIIASILLHVANVYHGDDHERVLLIVWPMPATSHLGPAVVEVLGLAYAKDVMVAFNLYAVRLMRNAFVIFSLSLRNCRIFLECIHNDLLLFSSCWHLGCNQTRFQLLLKE